MNNPKNIYNKPVFDRYSIQSVPSGYAEGSYLSLFRFLGSFWRNLHTGREFLTGLQKVRGLRLAQFYLDLIESLKLCDRKGMPVFHREMWKPFVIRKSQRNTAQENSLRMGDPIVLGAQKAGSAYGEGTELYMGRLANFEKFVTYPVDSDIVTIVSGIADNVLAPKVAWKSGEDFTYSNGTLIIPVELDPFGENSPFDVYDVADDNGDDVEAVLWASDALIDRNYLSDHMAYALGTSIPSTDIAKRIANAGWDALNCGLTPELLRTLVAAMLNIPVVQEAEEKVENILEKDESGYITVLTDKNTYSVYGKAGLLDNVRAGAVLHRGDLLDTSVRIYPFLTGPELDKLAESPEVEELMKYDIPVIDIPPTILSTDTAHGLYVDWVETEVKSAGTFDDGRKKLYFDLGGSKEDVEAFWQDVWDKAEAWDIDLDDYLDEGETLSSAEFFLRYLIGANTLIVSIDRNKIEDVSIIRDPKFFGMLTAVVPSGIRMFFIERLTTSTDEADLDDVSGKASDSIGTSEDTALYAAEDIDDDDDEFDYEDLPGLHGRRTPSYDDQVEMKFIRNRKRNSRNREES